MVSFSSAQGWGGCSGETGKDKKPRETKEASGSESEAKGSRYNSGVVRGLGFGFK